MSLDAFQDITWILPFRSEFLTEYFKSFMLLGHPSTYVMILAIFFWYSNSRFAVFMAFATGAATFICNFIKLTFQIPRPPVEYHLIDAPSFGFPSGDVLLVTTFWILLALHYNKPWLYALCLFLIPNVMLSRMYLGVHSPLDVTTGMIVGVVTAWYLNSDRFQRVFESWLNKEKLKTYWTLYFATFIFVIIAFNDIINTPIAVALGVFFGLGIAFSKGFILTSNRPSMYILSAAITFLVLLYIFIPSTLVSGQYKWVNQVVKFALISLYIFYFAPKCFKAIEDDEELKEA